MLFVLVIIGEKLTKNDWSSPSRNCSKRKVAQICASDTKHYNLVPYWLKDGDAPWL